MLQSLIKKYRKLLIWLLVAPLFILGLWLASLNIFSPAKAFFKALLVFLFYGSIILANTYWLIPQFFQKQRWWLFGLFNLALNILFTSSRFFIADQLQLFPPVITSQEYISLSFGQLMAVNFFVQHNLALAITLLVYLLNSWTQSRLKQNRLEQEKLQAELSFLKSQVNPHFLFNTLNNIYALAYTQDPKTPEIILKLADMMRYLVEECKSKTVPLKQEIQFLENYLELQKLKSPRYEQIALNYGEMQGYYRLPPLLLLPFFENLFKHSDLERNPKGWATVDLEQHKDHLSLTIENTYNNQGAKPVRAIKSKGGFGIRNVIKRLNLLYGESYTLKYSQEETWKVELEIPINL